MRWNRIAAIVLRQFWLMRGSPARVLSLFSWILIDIVLWGFLSRYLNTVASPGFNFVPVLLGAVLLWDFFTRVMQGVTMASNRERMRRRHRMILNLVNLDKPVAASRGTSSGIIR